MTAPQPGPTRRWLRWLGVAVVALIGAGIGATLLGRTSVTTSVGEVELTGRPSIRGGATVSLAPLGSVDLPGAVPMHLQARLVALNDALLVQAGQGLARGDRPISSRESERIADQVAERIADSVGPLALRTVAGGIVGGALTALLVYRTRRECLVGAAVGAVAIGSLAAAALLTLPDGVDDAQVNGAIGLLPQADPGLVESAEGVQDYIGKTFRNIEGLYSGYVRSVAANRIARTSERIIAVSGEPTDDARRRVAVLANSQGATGVLWIVDPPAGGSASDPLADPDDAGEGSDDGQPAALGSGSEAPVVFVPPGATAGFRFLDRFPVLVLDPDGAVPTGPTAGAIDDAAVVVEPGGGEVSAEITRPAVSIGDRPSAAGARLTDTSGAVRVTTGTIVEDRLEAVVLSYGRNGADIVQAQLVTVADGDISVTRVLR